MGLRRCRIRRCSFRRRAGRWHVARGGLAGEALRCRCRERDLYRRACGRCWGGYRGGRWPCRRARPARPAASGSHPKVSGPPGPVRPAPVRLPLVRPVPVLAAHLSAVRGRAADRPSPLPISPNRIGPNRIGPSRSTRLGRPSRPGWALRGRLWRDPSRGFAGGQSRRKASPVRCAAGVAASAASIPPFALESKGCGRGRGRCRRHRWPHRYWDSASAVATDCGCSP